MDTKNIPGTEFNPIRGTQLNPQQLRVLEKLKNIERILKDKTRSPQQRLDSLKNIPPLQPPLRR